MKNLASFFFAFCWCSAVSAAQCEDNHRPIKHIGGVTCVVENPQRIVSMHGLSLTVALFELGAGDRIVGNQTVTYGGSTLPHLGSETLFHTDLSLEKDGIENIGNYGAFDIEVIASLKPDLILGRSWDKEFYSLLSRAGPTVLINDQQPISNFVGEVAHVIGNQSEHAALVEAFDKHVAEVNAQFPSIGDLEIAILQTEPFENLMVYQDFGALTEALQKLGGRMPEAVKKLHTSVFGEDTQRSRTELSAERIDIVDADLLLIPYWYKLVDATSDLETFPHPVGVEYALDGFERRLPNYCAFLKVCQRDDILVFEATPTYSPTFSGLQSALKLIESILAEQMAKP